MTSHPIWMPLYIADYLADTRHLTAQQHGAYLLLIMEYWTKGRLPDGDDASMRRIASLTRGQWHRHKGTLAALFKQPGWRHSRIDRELEKANDLRLKRQIYGSQGGRKRYGRNNVERFAIVPSEPKQKLKPGLRQSPSK